MSDLPSVVQRFLRYVTVDTQSSEISHSVPSSPGQRIFQEQLCKELCDLGLKEVTLDEHSTLMATIESNIDRPVPTIGFIAHVDTSPEVSGLNVKPQLHENYQGEPLNLKSENATAGEYVLTAQQSKNLRDHIGDTIITSDGSTLLGADNKAGVAEIMTLVERLQQDPSIPHGKIRIAFTCDEEIGQGTRYFNLPKFGCEYAYTVDGETPGEIENETFCADDASIVFQGVNVHPGYAKNKMVNAVRAATYFVQLFPMELAPENTDDREGYMHPRSISGSVEEMVVKVIMRDFEEENLKRYGALLHEFAAKTREKYPLVPITIDIQPRYRNMRYVLEKYPQVVEYALQATQRTGLTPHLRHIRGGTDGSHLTLMGLPTPNIFTGGHLFHSRLEWIGVSSMVKTVETLVHLVQIWVEKAEKPQL